MSNKSDTIADPNAAAAIEALADVVRELIWFADIEDSDFGQTLLEKLRTVRAQLRGGETSVGSA